MYSLSATLYLQVFGRRVLAQGGLEQLASVPSGTEQAHVLGRFSLQLEFRFLQPSPNEFETQARYKKRADRQPDVHVGQSSRRRLFVPFRPVDRDPRTRPRRYRYRRPTTDYLATVAVDQQHVAGPANRGADDGHGAHADGPGRTVDVGQPGPVE